MSCAGWRRAAAETTRPAGFGPLSWLFVDLRGRCSRCDNVLDARAVARAACLRAARQRQPACRCLVAKGRDACEQMAPRRFSPNAAGPTRPRSRAKTKSAAFGRRRGCRGPRWAETRCLPNHERAPRQEEQGPVSQASRHVAGAGDVLVRSRRVARPRRAVYTSQAGPRTAAVQAGVRCSRRRRDRPLHSLPPRSARPETTARSAGMDASQIGDEPLSFA